MTTDVLIAGAGLAGSTAAIALARSAPDMQVMILSTDALSECSSARAQGGIAVPDAADPDDAAAHVRDTIRAGGGVCDPHVVRTIIAEAPAVLAFLESCGVAFDRTDRGTYARSREGGHDRPRVMHTADHTGATVMENVHRELRAEDGGRRAVHEHHRLVELQRDEECWVATIVHTQTNERYRVYARTVILATGGMGRVFGHTTNPASAVGDAVLLASQVGCRLRDLHRVQFHPTGLNTRDAQGASAPLITEALRGAGAHIVNEDGERFLQRVDERGELATRDVVTRALLDHLERSPNAKVFLDCRHMDAALLHTSFPAFVQTCTVRGLDPARDLIPIKPVAHYQCGGIITTLDGATDRPALYAIGECASTGMHGVTRLASNSLLEAVVMGLRCARHIVEQQHLQPFRRGIEALSEQLAHIVTHSASASEIRTLIEQIEHLGMQHQKQRVHDRQWYDDRSLLHASLLVLRSMLTQAGGTEPGRSEGTSARRSSPVR